MHALGIYVCMCIYVYMHVHMYGCKYICLQVCIYECVHVYIYVCVYLGWFHFFVVVYAVWILHLLGCLHVFVHFPPAAIVAGVRCTLLSLYHLLKVSPSVVACILCMHACVYLFCK